MSKQKPIKSSSKFGHLPKTEQFWANINIFEYAMKSPDNYHIELCIKLLEEKFSFGNGHGYTQKDLEQLSSYIEEHTGYYISLSTLKRVWKGTYKTQPQIATLNALVEVLGYKNWQDFKIQHQKAKVEEEEETDEAAAEGAETPEGEGGEPEVAKKGASEGEDQAKD